MKKFTNSTTCADAHRNDSFEAFRMEVLKYNVLCQEEETQLAQMIVQGKAEGNDRIVNDAVDMLVNHNIRIVFDCVKKRKGDKALDDDDMDMIAAGCKGLIKAAHSFNPSRGYRFFAYAQRAINNAINDELAENGNLIHLPADTMKMAKRMAEAEEHHITENGTVPTYSELAEMCGCKVGKVIECLKALCFISLDAERYKDEEDSITWADTIACEESPETQPLYMESLRHDLNAVCSSLLTDREIYVLFHGFGVLGHPKKSHKELAAELHVKPDTVGNILIRVIKKIQSRPECMARLSKYLAA
ncbi:MAG: sigma-70 family RNA polymerase sigma factor [Muribaculaceae bacterium]|nr:sigma-70 family RNA polymerase sigma factor [Muribaculaceae bacterium]